MKQDVFDIIDKIAREHSNKKIGYLDKGDVQGEIWKICLEALEDFKPKKGELEHFLRSSVRNRLINMFREITKVSKSPCINCPFYRPGSTPDCAEFGEDKYKCKKFRNFELASQTKNALLVSSENDSSRYFNSTADMGMITRETIKIIEDNIDESFKIDWDKMIAGEKLSARRLKKLKEEIHDILNFDEHMSNARRKNAIAKSQKGSKTK